MSHLRGKDTLFGNVLCLHHQHFTLMKDDEIVSFLFAKKGTELMSPNQPNFVLLPRSVKVGHQVYTVCCQTTKYWIGQINDNRKLEMKEILFFSTRRAVHFLCKPREQVILANASTPGWKKEKKSNLFQSVWHTDIRSAVLHPHTDKAAFRDPSPTIHQNYPGKQQRSRPRSLDLCPAQQ